MDFDSKPITSFIYISGLIFLLGTTYKLLGAKPYMEEGEY